MKAQTENQASNLILQRIIFVSSMQDNSPELQKCSGLTSLQGDETETKQTIELKLSPIYEKNLIAVRYFQRINNVNIQKASTLFYMLRGKKDQAAVILEEIISSPKLPPTRLLAKVGLNYGTVKALLPYGLIEQRKISQNRVKLEITEKGRTFLQHYRICNELLPS